MAKRAKEAFVTAVLPVGKKAYTKDAIVPDDIAERVPKLVYDDGAPTVKKSGKPAPAE
jgi:hypothetical protein